MPFFPCNIALFSYFLLKFRNTRCFLPALLTEMCTAWLASPINCGAFVMLAGLVIVPVVSLMTPVKNKNEVEEAFSSMKNAEKD